MPIPEGHMILANFPEVPSGTHSGSQGKLTCAPLIFEKSRQICMCAENRSLLKSSSAIQRNDITS